MLALSPGRTRGRADRLLISAIEHPSVLAGGRFPAAAVERYCAVTAHGHIDLGAFERRPAAGRARVQRPLVSVMLAINESGVVQPIAKLARLVHAAGGGILHRRGPGRRPNGMRHQGSAATF